MYSKKSNNFKNNIQKQHYEKKINIVYDAVVIGYNKNKIIFSFNNKLKGYIIKQELFDLTNEKIYEIFKIGSKHICMVQSFQQNLNLYKLNYHSIHPEIWPLYFYKIVPTASHFRNLKKDLISKLKRK